MNPTEYAKALQASMAGKELAFPVEEFDQRIKAARRAMDAAGLDVLLVTHRPDLCYLTGYSTFGVGNHACFVLPREGDPVLQVTAIEIPAGTAASWVRDLRCAPWVGQASAGAQLGDIVKEKGFDAKRIGIQTQISGLLPNILDQIKAALPKATFADASELVARQRFVKSPREMACLRKAAAYTEAGVRASLAVIRAGTTDNDVVRAGYDAMIAAGSEFMTVQPIVTSGARTGYAHQSFRRLTIAPGDPVFLEYGGCHQRYTSALMRTAVAGQPEKGVEALADAVLATIDAVIATARPGRTGHDVAMAAKAAHKHMSDEFFLPGAYGYHVGIGFPPTWADVIGFLAEGSEIVLEPDMVFHLPLAFRCPGRFGVGISETIHITKAGCEPMTNLPRGLHRAPG
ncbi:MAG: Xaa-Pro peptidase family protein [Alphaproteobacteria bacterium]